MGLSTHGEAQLRVVVIGASVAGLFTAAAAAGGQHEVTVLERDELPQHPAPRPGVPQGAQPHVFLYRGLLAVQELLPGSRQQLLDAGAVPFDTGEMAWLAEQGWLPVGQPEFEVVSLTRPLFEHVIRARVAQLVGVRIRPGSRVTGLRRRGRDWELVLADGTSVLADLVVDASGRGSRLPVWLARVGVGPVRVSDVSSGVGYATRLYGGAPGPGTAVGVVIQQIPATLTGGMALPVEGGRWQVTAVGCGPRRPPRDPEGFVSFLRRLRDPVLAELVRDAEPLSPVAVHRQTGNRRVYYERVRNWPDGLLAVGDALCTFNPIYGQGITVAACEAVLLRDALAGGLSPGYSRWLLRQFATVVALPWNIATSEDLRYPTSAGHQSPAQALLGWWTRQLSSLAVHGDRRALAALARVYHLMGSPALLFHPVFGLAALRAWLTGYQTPAPRPAVLTTLTQTRRSGS